MFGIFRRLERLEAENNNLRDALHVEREARQALRAALDEVVAVQRGDELLRDAQDRVIGVLDTALAAQAKRNDSSIELLERRCDALDAHVSGMMAMGPVSAINTRADGMETEIEDAPELGEDEMDDLEMTAEALGLTVEQMGDPLAPTEAEDPEKASATG